MSLHGSTSQGTSARMAHTGAVVLACCAHVCWWKAASAICQLIPTAPVGQALRMITAAVAACLP